MWDAEASRFDEPADHGLRDPAVRAAWTELLTAALPPSPCRVADLGCGTGTLAVLLASLGYAVRGLDFSAAMIALARAKATAAEVAVELRVGDAMAPPWPAGEFDVVLSRHVLWALPDPARGLERWRALLAPGGRLVLVEGRWWNGAGLSAAESLALVHGAGSRDVTVTPLDDPALWGGPIADERYLLVASLTRPVRRPRTSR
jgi:SAM-dependent methyltransferase